nr:carbohydrate kinase family protein [Anaerolineae bacterium]
MSCNQSLYEKPKESMPAFSLPDALLGRPWDIVTIGNAKLEMVAQVPHWPEAGGQHDASMSRPVLSAGGCATNVACLAARFTASTRMIARMGSGQYSQPVQAELERSGVDPEWLIPMEGSEGNLLIIATDPAGDWMVLSYMDPDLELRPEDIPPESAFQDVRFLHIDGFSLETPHQKKAVELAIERAHASGCLVSIDAAVPVAKAQPEYLAKLFRSCDFVFANQAEALAVTGHPTVPDALDTLQHMGARVTCVKMGPEGSWILTPTLRAPVPAFKVQVVDTLAAGDALIAGLLTALSQGRPLMEAARWGSAAGALACTGSGSLSRWFSSHDVQKLMDTGSSTAERTD